jgi:hypothetical protein
MRRIGGCVAEERLGAGVGRVGRVGDDAAILSLHRAQWDVLEVTAGGLASTDHHVPAEQKRAHQQPADRRVGVDLRADQLAEHQ